jgi:hypothetical protein
MLSWAPNEVVEVDDANVAAVEFYERLIAGGNAERLDAPSEPGPGPSEPGPAPVAKATKAGSRTRVRG